MNIRNLCLSLAIILFHVKSYANQPEIVSFPEEKTVAGFPVQSMLTWTTQDGTSYFCTPGKIHAGYRKNNNEYYAYVSEDDFSNKQRNLPNPYKIFKTLETLKP